MVGPKDDSSMLVQIHREVGETKISVENLSNNLDRHISYTREELHKINQLDQEQNRSLDKHIEGVNTLKELYLNHKKESEQRINLLTESIDLQKQELTLRIQTLERPYDILKYVGKTIIWVATVGAGILTIYNWVKM